MTSETNSRVGWADLPRLAGVAIVYALLVKFVLDFFSANGIVSIVWPPSGLALATLLIGGKKYWPGIFAGALMGEVMAGSPAAESFCMAAGNTLEALVCIFLLDYRGGFNTAFNNSRNYWKLVMSGAIGSCVNALTGCITLLMFNAISWVSLPHNLLSWWRGDFLGIVLMTPLLMVWRRVPRGWFSGTRVAETMLYFALALLFGQVVFLDWLHDSVGQVARGYWMFLFVVWGAVRFGRHGTLLIIAIFGLQALLGAAHHTGFFRSDIADTGLSNFWFYMLILTVVGVSLAVVMAERRMDEIQLREKSDALQRSNSDLEQFAYGVSHDMRQPLRAVSGHLELLKLSLEVKLDEDDRENLRFALDGAKRMDSMIVSLLEYSRIGRKFDTKKWVQSRQLLDEAFGFLEPIIRQTKAEIEVNGVWPKVFASSDELVRLFQNLIGNAVHYHEPGQFPHILIESVVNVNIWQVSVRDQGIGIDPGQTDRLFQFFSRLQTYGHFEGTGMGLALCRRIVEHHDGRIWVESEGKNKGSTFIFELKLLPTDSEGEST